MVVAPDNTGAPVFRILDRNDKRISTWSFHLYTVLEGDEGFPLDRGCIYGETK